MPRQLSLEATTLASLMCLAAIFSQLQKRGLVTLAELEDTLAVFSASLDQEEASPKKWLLPDTPADARTYLDTLLQILKSKPDNPDDPKSRLRADWLRGVIDGGKSERK